jgi:putative membrane protein
MKALVWLIRVLVFLVLLVLALANTHEATLNLLAGHVWQAPLILIGLAFFAVGAVAGLLFSMRTNVRRRIEINRLQREVRATRDALLSREDPPTPPLV